MEGTDPVSSSRRSMQTALAMEIKLAEEERRRLEAQRHDRLLSYAAAQPLPDDAPPAPGMQPLQLPSPQHPPCHSSPQLTPCHPPAAEGLLACLVQAVGTVHTMPKLPWMMSGCTGCLP